MLDATQLDPWPVFGFALLGRLFDVLSTRVVSPRLALELNPLVRRYGWAYAWATLAAALLAFVSPAYGLLLATVSCLMGFANMSNALIARHGLGESGLRRLHARALRRCPAREYLLLCTLQFAPILVLAIALLLLTGGREQDPVAIIAYGMLLWVAAVLFYRVLNLRRLKRMDVSDPSSIVDAG